MRPTLPLFSMNPSRIKNINPVCWALLLGILAFLFITGGRILVPTYTDWLMSNGDDPAQHYLGWVFFRNAPVFQWPYGANPMFGMGMSGGIAHTDSIPLMALLFKPFKYILPEPFQYTGLWIFASFLLMAFFSWRLLSLFTKDKWLPLAGSAFFLIAPMWLFKVGVHNSSFGQWALVASLYFYLRREFRFAHWLPLILVISLVNTYLMIMVVLLFLADIVQRLLCTRQLGILRAAGCIAAVCACTGLAMYAAGSFMVMHGLKGGGFGVYRMNLLSMFDPNGKWSLLLPDIGEGPGDYEGFNYSGLGMLVLALPALWALAHLFKRFFKLRLIPLALLCVVLTVYAISNRIAFGSSEICTYQMPAWMEFFANSVRCSGRLFWPVHYLLYATVFFLLFRYLKPRAALALCLVMLAVQLADSSPETNWARRRFIHPAEWSSPMQAGVWSGIADRYSKLMNVLPAGPGAQPVDNWLPLMDYAGAHHMSAYTGYFSRVEFDKAMKARNDMAKTVFEGRFKPDALYFFNDDMLWCIAREQAGPDDICGTLDGFRIFAPGLKKNPPEGLSAIVADGPDGECDYDCRVDPPVDFGPGKKWSRYGFGWSGAEKWGGMWSEGAHAYLFVRLANIPDGDADLVIMSQAYVQPEHPEQNITVRVNGEELGTMRYSRSRNRLSRTLRIPHELMAGHNGALFLQFDIPDAISPAELGKGSDGRRLGIGIYSLELKSLPSE